jgi:hypothetical protein
MIAACHCDVSIFQSVMRDAPLQGRWGLTPYGALSGGLKLCKVGNLYFYLYFNYLRRFLIH